MVFNVEDYNENIDYCKYVFDKNISLGLGLIDSREIQLVANNYVDELIELQDGYLGEDVIANELLLIQVVKEYITNLRVLEEHKITEETIESDILAHTQTEMLKNNRGGYDFNDFYDDKGLDERDIESEMKL